MRYQSLTGFHTKKASKDDANVVQTGTVVGAAVGTLAAVAVSMVAALVVYKWMHRKNQVDQAASTSDVKAMIPDLVIPDAPNSVPPAGTS